MIIIMPSKIFRHGTVHIGADNVFSGEIKMEKE
jgi:hypothetical protein